MSFIHPESKSLVCSKSRLFGCMVIPNPSNIPDSTSNTNKWWEKMQNTGCLKTTSHQLIKCCLCQSWRWKQSHCLCLVSGRAFAMRPSLSGKHTFFRGGICVCFFTVFKTYHQISSTSFVIFIRDHWSISIISHIPNTHPLSVTNSKACGMANGATPMGPPDFQETPKLATGVRSSSDRRQQVRYSNLNVW